MNSAVISGVILAVLLGSFYVTIPRLGLHNLLIKKKGQLAKNIQWEETGATPLGEKGFTPQGMTWVDGKIIFANSWKNKRSRVYEIEPKTMEIKRHFDMPPEAVHTSGLAWDGKHLWGVDYISNRAYCFDLDASLVHGKPSIVGSFQTTLKGTSACCIIPWNGNKYLAISDFNRTKRTVFVQMYEALETGTAEGCIDFEYRNEGFSQGLEFVDGFLYESENKRGVDIINKIDLAKLAETKRSRLATVVQYLAPSRGIEDLAWDGSTIWTSDESTFRFYQGKFN